MEEIITKENYKDLANAIITQACVDYVKSKKALKQPFLAQHKQEEFKRLLDDTKRFFRSQWYRELTDLDRDFLISRLDEEAEGV